jgi:hypothetical protein
MLVARALFLSNQVPISAVSYGCTVSTRTELTPGAVLHGETCAALPFPIAVDKDGPAGFAREHAATKKAIRLLRLGLAGLCRATGKTP